MGRSSTKDIFEEYKDSLNQTDEAKLLIAQVKIFNAFLDETVKACEDRKINSWVEAQDILVAQDEKWRALCRRFANAAGKDILSEDAFTNRVLDVIPKAFKYTGGKAG